MYIRDAEKHFNGNIPDDATLEKLVENDDHRVELDEDDDRYGAYIHYYWACDTCAAEAILKHRRYLHESTLPGNLPALGNAVMHTIPVTKLTAGAFARYKPYPGTDYNWYAECLKVETVDGNIVATWKKTNADDEAEFTVTYPAELHLNLDVAESTVRATLTEGALR